MSIKGNQQILYNGASIFWTGFETWRSFQIDTMKVYYWICFVENDIDYLFSKEQYFLDFKNASFGFEDTNYSYCNSAPKQVNTFLLFRRREYVVRNRIEIVVH